MPPISPIKKDLRARLNEHLDNISEADLETWLGGLLSIERLHWGMCPNCKKKVQVDYPDYKGQGYLVSMLLDQAKGKPTERKEISITVGLKRVEDLSMEELAIEEAELVRQIADPAS